MTKTIAEIKRELKPLTSWPTSLLQTLKSDPRKGVQQLLKSKHRQLLKLKHKREAFKQRHHYENDLLKKGARYIAGIDEVGRGPLAGPVVTCAIILPKDFDLLDVNDSKQLSPRKRQALYPKILNEALDYSIGICSNHLIDAVNIYEADRIAMKKAVSQLSLKPDHLIIDAMQINVPIPQLKLYHGDAKSISVGAASIVAKVYRDHLMNQYAKEYPEYGFEHNAGYGTKEHLLGLRKYGACPIHRRSFAPVKKY